MPDHAVCRSAASLPPSSRRLPDGRAGAAVVGWWVVGVLQSEDIAQGTEWRYDVSRINELRRADPFYRLFQPVIQLLARLNRMLFRDSLPEISRQIQAAGLPRFWLPEEYLGQAGTAGPVPRAGLRVLFFAWFGRARAWCWPSLAVRPDRLAAAAAAGERGPAAAAADQAPHALPARTC